MSICQGTLLQLPVFSVQVAQHFPASSSLCVNHVGVEPTIALSSVSVNTTTLININMPRYDWLPISKYYTSVLTLCGFAPHY